VNAPIRRTDAIPFQIAIFLGAWLIFQIQPLMSRLILPWFGGTPQVWAVCLLFFQTLLFAGYLLAYGLSRLRLAKAQVATYGALLVAAIVSTRVIPAPEWKPTGEGSPTAEILLLLGRHIGLPYLALAATGPLLQHWFQLIWPGEKTYRLYALSNLGSLLALVSYSFLIDSLLPGRMQARLWQAGYIGYAVAVLAAGVTLTKKHLTAANLETPAASAALPRVRVVLWFLLAMVPSILLAAVTNKLTTDVTPVPFLWVLPLTLYLLSFIVCFAGQRWYWKRFWRAAAVLALGYGSIVMMREGGTGATGSISKAFLGYFALLVAVCMFCHGELARLKPDAARLTLFYLVLSAGGAAGGAFVGAIAPWVFNGYYELHVAVLGAFALWVVVDHLDSEPLLPQLRGRARWTAVGGVFVGLILLLAVEIKRTLADSVQVRRNFYGQLRIVERGVGRPRAHAIELAHGGTSHGLQYTHSELVKLPTGYYGRNSGAGLAMQLHHPERPRRVGIVGLGVGTLAAYGKEGDEFDFYEINPTVIDWAENVFEYLRYSPAVKRIIPGDARLSLERAERRDYDILILDAFSSDAIPIHLLTREAMVVYLGQCLPDAIIAVHISSRYLDLVPVLAGHARREKLAIAPIFDTGDRRQGTEPNYWVLLSRDSGALEIVTRGSTIHIPPANRYVDWTDDHSSLIDVLRDNIRL
jgi:hypothetical protein